MSRLEHAACGSGAPGRPFRVILRERIINIGKRIVFRFLTGRKRLKAFNTGQVGPDPGNQLPDRLLFAGRNFLQGF